MALCVVVVVKKGRFKSRSIKAWCSCVRKEDGTVVVNLETQTRKLINSFWMMLGDILDKLINLHKSLKFL